MNGLIDMVISSIGAILLLFIFNYLDAGLFERSYENFNLLTVFAWFFIIEWRIHELGSRELR